MSGYAPMVRRSNGGGSPGVGSPSRLPLLQSGEEDADRGTGREATEASAMRDGAPVIVGRTNSQDVPLVVKSSIVEGDSFQSLIGIVIVSNLFVIWGETDAPHLLVWTILDNAFLVIFIVEIILRIRHRGFQRYIFGDGEGVVCVEHWHVLDCVIVTVGVLDLWLMPIFGTAGSSGHKTSFLRFLRLLRLLRLFRLFEMFPALASFIGALKDMMGTFIWIFIVLFMFIFTCAIILTHLLGHGEALGPRQWLEKEHAEALHKTSLHFGNVPDSLFTLFKLTTIDNWDDIAYPVVEMNPWWRLFFVFFISFASWTMISVLTAVASNKMIAATANRKENETREQERKYQAFIEFLRNSFLAADEDGNGVLDMGEFSSLISQDFVHNRMKELGVHMSREELFKAWEMLDIDESGELTIEEFVTGLSTLQEGLATKHMVSVDYSLKRVSLKTEKNMNDMAKRAMDMVTESSDIHELFLQSEEVDPIDPEVSLFNAWKETSEIGATLRGD
mmetsp:Transcript_158892/g.505973  ORF Transcript_158892/g.505973 Transcript_158892/m.505973 type:complete len:504 (-) Transcript_158892:106-1617(-)